PSAITEVIKGLLAKAVASKDQSLAARVPDSEGEHPIQPPSQLDRGHVLGEVCDHLGVTARSHPVAGRDQLVANRPEVVDLAVEHDTDLFGLVRKRRISRLKVDYRQPVLRDYAAAGSEPARSVRATVTEPLELTVDNLR